MPNIIDWADVKSIKGAIAQKLPVSLLIGKLFSHRLPHQKTLAALSPRELTWLAKQGGTMPAHIGYTAGSFKNRRDFEKALTLYDALLDVPARKVDLANACNALDCVLDSTHNLGVMPERARRFLSHFMPLAPQNAAMYINAALLLTELGDLSAAIEALSEGIAHGESRIRDKWLGDPQLKALKKHPGYAALGDVLPTYPPALRKFQEQLVVFETPALVNANISLEWISGLLEPLPAAMGFDSKAFRVFGSLPDGGHLAFWVRAEDAPLERQPVVIFGSDGQYAVYATDLRDFFVLVAAGWDLHATENAGFRLHQQWKAPKATALAKLSMRDNVVAALGDIAPEVKKKNPNRARTSAGKLNAEFQNVLEALHS